MHKTRVYHVLRTPKVWFPCCISKDQSYILQEKAIGMGLCLIPDELYKFPLFTYLLYSSCDISYQRYDTLKWLCYILGTLNMYTLIHPNIYSEEVIRNQCFFHVYILCGHGATWSSSNIQLQCKQNKHCFYVTPLKQSMHYII